MGKDLSVDFAMNASGALDAQRFEACANTRRAFLVSLLQRRIDAGQDATGAIAVVQGLLQRAMAGDVPSAAEWDAAHQMTERRLPAHDEDVAMSVAMFAVESECPMTTAADALEAAAMAAESAAAWSDGSELSADSKALLELRTQIADFAKALA